MGTREGKGLTIERGGTKEGEGVWNRRVGMVTRKAECEC